MVRIARYFLNLPRKNPAENAFLPAGNKAHAGYAQQYYHGKEKDLSVLDKLQELAEDISVGSLCNLGKTAPNPVLTTLKIFPEEYEAHILEGRRLALMCKDLIVYFIDPEKCSKLCNVCVGSCPVEAIYTRDDGLKAINQGKVREMQQLLESLSSPV